MQTHSRLHSHICSGADSSVKPNIACRLKEKHCSKCFFFFFFTIAQIQKNHSTWIILTLSNAVWASLSALQCDARGRYSRGRLIEETDERVKEGGRTEREGSGRERKGGENAAPLDFGDVSQYCVRIFIDSPHSVLPEYHMSIHKPLATHWKIEFRLPDETEGGNRCDEDLISWDTSAAVLDFIIQRANTIRVSRFSARLYFHRHKLK